MTLSKVVGELLGSSPLPPFPPTDLPPEKTCVCSLVCQEIGVDGWTYLPTLASWSLLWSCYHHLQPLWNWIYIGGGGSFCRFLPAFWDVWWPLAWRGVDFCSLVTDFLTDFTKVNRMVKITTTWGIWFFLFQASNMQIPSFGAYYVGVLVSQSLRKCGPFDNLGGKIQDDSGMVVVFPPRTKRGGEKRPSLKERIISKPWLWLLVSWRVRPYIIKGSWWFFNPLRGFLASGISGLVAYS